MDFVVFVFEGRLFCRGGLGSLGFVFGFIDYVVFFFFIEGEIMDIF